VSQDKLVINARSGSNYNSMRGSSVIKESWSNNCRSPWNH